MSFTPQPYYTPQDTQATLESVIDEITARAQDFHTLYANFSAVAASAFAWQFLPRLNELIRVVLAQKRPDLVRAGDRFERFIGPPGFLTSEAQHQKGEAHPVVIFFLCETTRAFPPETTVLHCFMLMSTGCVEPYDSAMTTRLGGRDWNNTTFVPCFSLGRREIPKDLGELKILEEDNEAAMLAEAREHAAYMVQYEADYAEYEAECEAESCHL